MQDPFPLHAICGGVWKNAEGQLSFLKYAVTAPPEIFTFGHSARQLVRYYVDPLIATVPYVIGVIIMVNQLLLQTYDDAVHGHKLQLGHANHAWLCLDLLDVLCQLAERGYATFVQSMLEYPLKNCPEVLLLGMAHVNVCFLYLIYVVIFDVMLLDMFFLFDKLFICFCRLLIISSSMKYLSLFSQ